MRRVTVANGLRVAAAPAGQAAHVAVVVARRARVLPLAAGGGLGHGVPTAAAAVSRSQGLRPAVPHGPVPPSTLGLGTQRGHVASAMTGGCWTFAL